MKTKIEFSNEIFVRYNDCVAYNLHIVSATVKAIYKVTDCGSIEPVHAYAHDDCDCWFLITGKLTKFEKLCILYDGGEYCINLIEKDGEYKITHPQVAKIMNFNKYSLLDKGILDAALKIYLTGEK